MIAEEFSPQKQHRLMLIEVQNSTFLIEAFAIAVSVQLFFVMVKSLKVSLLLPEFKKFWSNEMIAD